MKDTNLVSWWCLNTKRGWLGQKGWRGLQITSYGMSVRLPNGVQCHLTLNLQSSDGRCSSGSSLYSSGILSQRVLNEMREEAQVCVLPSTFRARARWPRGIQERGQRREKEKQERGIMGLGTKKWKVLLQNTTVLVLLSTDCRPTMVCHNKIICIYTALNSC